MKDEISLECIENATNSFCIERPSKYKKREALALFPVQFNLIQLDKIDIFICSQFVPFGIRRHRTDIF